MGRITRIFCVFLLTSVLASFSGGCGTEDAQAAPSTGEKAADPAARRETLTAVLTPETPGTQVYGNDTVSIDASCTSEGYVCVRYTGSVEKIKMQLTTPDSTVYTYTLNPGDYEAFPLSGGDGEYHLDVLENVVDDRYALLFSQDLAVALSDPFKPFLYPNQYVWFTPESKAVALARELSESSVSDLDYVTQVYHYVIEHISYDTEAAKNIPKGYLPDIDVTLSTGKGICFDYASLMSAMLRSQGVPTKLEVGYSGQAYHAWISVYLDEIGWVDKIIEFDGKSWSLLDPTLAASNDPEAVQEYVGDGSNYTVKYSY